MFLVIGAILAAVAAVVVTSAALLSSLKKSKTDAGKNFSEKPVGESKEPCPLKSKKLISVEWSKQEVMCDDEVDIIGKAKNFDPNTKATATVSIIGKSNVATVQSSGRDSLILPWRVAKVTFSGESMPDMYELKADLSAIGQKVTTENVLKVVRVPDKDLEAVSIGISSGRFAWTAAFKVGIDKDKLKVKQTIHHKKAWLGKWITFDPTLDSGKTGWAWVKNAGTAWKYWDSTDSTSDPKAWKSLPRNVSSYTVSNVVFIKSGQRYVSRDDASNVWPETFTDPSNYDTKKAAWLNNIHSVWDNKFDLVRKHDGEHGDGCCKWRIRVSVNWSATSGDKLVYIISSQAWERSNAKDWYLSENRVGVAAHECGHLLGAYDEYSGGAVDLATNIIDGNTIMGQQLTVGKARHFDNLLKEVTKKINGWIGRNWEFEVKKS